MITNVSLTTKEKNLLEDQKKDEELCIKKYSDYSNLASDKELKDLFTKNMKMEEQHLKTLNQILSGETPTMSSQQSQSSSSGQSGSSSSQSQSSSSQSGSSSGSSQSVKSLGSTSSQSQSTDKDLCSDILMTEKYVSGAYDTAIFEFRDPAIRDALNHIQKEEQKHGESVYKYMESKGMYNPQS